VKWITGRTLTNSTPSKNHLSRRLKRCICRDKSKPPFTGYRVKEVRGRVVNVQPLLNKTATYLPIVDCRYVQTLQVMRLDCRVSVAIAVGRTTLPFKQSDTAPPLAPAPDYYPSLSCRELHACFEYFWLQIDCSLPSTS
jgi:hypothetical protein